MDRRRSDPRSSWVSGARFSTAAPAIVASGDGALSRYSVPALEGQSSVPAHQGAVWSCAANARAVLSGGTDSTARVWDPGSLDARRVLEGHQAWVLGTALSRDGTVAVTGGARRLRLCVGPGFRCAAPRALGHRGAVSLVGLVEQGDRVVTGSDDQTLRVWSLGDGRCLSVLPGTRARHGDHAAPRRRAAAVGRLRPHHPAVGPALGPEIERLEGSADWVLSLLATPDGTLAAAGTNGGEVLCWDLTSLELVAQLPLHQGPVMSVDFLADAGLLSGSADKTVALLSTPLTMRRLTTGEEVVVEDGAVDLGIPGLTDAVEVARGGFSTVFRARQSAMERTVAVKLIHATVVDPVAGEHFLREVRATGRLSQHPNVAPVYDVGTTTTGQPYLIMPYYERGSLEQRLTEPGALSEGEAVRLARTLATTLEYVHQHGILHRDIKPANVLLTEFDEPLLADFGVARLVDGSVPVHTTGANVVTWAYGPPEAFTGGEPTAAWDIYSLGATVYAMLTGQPPFVDGGDANVFTVLNRIGNVEVPDLRDRGISAPVADAVRKTMAKDPADRPASAAELATMLARPLPRLASNRSPRQRSW